MRQPGTSYPIFTFVERKDGLYDMYMCMPYIGCDFTVATGLDDFLVKEYAENCDGCYVEYERIRRRKPKAFPVSAVTEFTS